MSEIVVPLTIRDLTREDLDRGMMGWSDHKRASRATEVDRARQGEVDYLTVCTPSGLPVATGGVDFAHRSGQPEIWQLEVQASLQSCGIGTLLIEALEQRIRGRGLGVAQLGFDENQPRPRALYERLGYAVCGREADGWDQENPDGSLSRYETMITIMRKQLDESSAQRQAQK